jgi:hypothetical protein
LRLDEAYANSGDKQHALDAYRKSVELNPENTNAKHDDRANRKGSVNVSLLAKRGWARFRK